MNHKNYRFMFTLYFIVFGITIALFGSLVGYKIQMIDIQERIDQNAEEVSYNKKINMLKPSIDKMDNIVSSIANNGILKRYIQSQNQETKATAIDLFLAIAMSDKQIMQVRYLDAKGKEKLRVDRLNESSLPFVVADAKLQDKSTRDYFQTASKLPVDKIWHSRLDLNIENGKVEVPYRPTIRIATPIYSQNTFKGIVIVNMLTNDLLNALRTSPVFDHYIIDKEGNIIIHPDDRLSWSRYAASPAKLITDFPTEASQIIAGQAKGEDFYTFKLDDILQNDDDALLVLKPKAQYKHSLILSNIQSAVFVIILSILMSIPLAIYASITPSNLQKALFKSNNELKRFADIIDKYVITVTTKTNSIITQVSSAFEKISGYSKEELIGQKINLVKHPDTPKAFHNYLWSTIENGQKWQGEVKNLRKDGREYWLEQTIIPIKNENGNVTSYLSVGADTTAKKELEKLSITDQLTGIFNRRKLNESLASEVEKAKRYKRPLALLMIDIDHFKQINDTYGHQVGDYTLTAVSEILTRSIRNSDIAGRYGGEEFMIICPETSEDSAKMMAEKLRLAISEYTYKHLEGLTISIGVAKLEEDITTETLISRSDSALYAAKRGGRNQSVIFESTANAPL